MLILPYEGIHVDDNLLIQLQNLHFTALDIKFGFYPLKVIRTTFVVDFFTVPIIITTIFIVISTA